jgi:hypothetical protein
MKRLSPKMVGVLIVLFVAIVAAAFYFSSSSMQSGSTEQTAGSDQSATTTAESGSHAPALLKYTNTKYKFSIQYPDGLSVVTNAQQSVFTLQARQRHISADEMGTFNVEVGNLPGQCKTPAGVSASTTNINGVNFTTYTTSPQTDSKNTSKGRVYYALHAGTCYQLNQTISAASYDFENYNSYASALFYTAAHNFRFTN